MSAKELQEKLFMKQKNAYLRMDENEAEKVNPFLDIDFEYYQYFGW